METEENIEVISVFVKLNNQDNLESFANVVNAYERGSFYCICSEGNIVDKFPIANIYSITELPMEWEINK